VLARGGEAHRTDATARYHGSSKSGGGGNFGAHIPGVYPNPGVYTAYIQIPGVYENEEFVA